MEKGNYLVWGVGFSMYSVIMGHLGSDAVAANSIQKIWLAAEHNTGADKLK